MRATCAGWKESRMNRSARFPVRCAFWRRISSYLGLSAGEIQIIAANDFAPLTRDHILCLALESLDELETASAAFGGGSGGKWAAHNCRPDRRGKTATRRRGFHERSSAQGDSGERVHGDHGVLCCVVGLELRLLPCGRKLAGLEEVRRRRAAKARGAHHDPDGEHDQQKQASAEDA